MRKLIATAALAAALAAVLAAVLALAACGGGTDTITLDNYEAALRDAVCRNLAHCGDIASVDACGAANFGVLAHVSPGVQAAVDMGKIDFHGDLARSCLDALADSSCDVTSRASRVAPAACNFVTGTQHDGAACAYGAECISQFCTVPSCGAACCQGTCTGDALPVLGKVGDSCELVDCDDDSFCDFDAGLCVALAANNAFCISPDECDYGLDCLPTGTCGALPALGAPCDGACRDIGTTCSQATGTCVKVALAGEACTTSADCSVLYTCDATRHCSPGLALGAACGAGERCADDLAFCDVAVDETIGSCALPKSNGGGCTSSTQCQSVYCDPVLLTCADEPVCF
jgi:hypothetical protein